MISDIVSYSLARIGKTKDLNLAATFAVVTFHVLGWAKAGQFESSITSIGLANENLQGVQGKYETFESREQASK